MICFPLKLDVFIISLYGFTIATSLFITVSEGTLYDFVTCGSVLKLVNSAHDTRLHSHEVRYGSGSGQQSVTAIESRDDAGSYWRVREATGREACSRGLPVRCGSTLRLTHLASGKNLHSHLYSSPITQQQEVSAFGDNGEGDHGDDWQLVCPGGDSGDSQQQPPDSGLWRRGGRVRFRHSVTERYLHVSGERYGRPIAGQAEVSAVPSPSYGSDWVDGEGIFLKPGDGAAIGGSGRRPSMEAPRVMVHDSGEL